MSQKIIPIIIILGALAAGAYYWFAVREPEASQQEPQSITPLERENEKSEGLGGELYEKTQNPAERIPETNPFQKANPFSGKTNPFE